jgi:hypothetical protein
MKIKFPVPVKIVSLLLLSAAAFFYFLWEDSQRTPGSSTLIDAIQDVRTFGLKNRPSMIRKIGEDPKWLDGSLNILYRALDSGKDPSGSLLTTSLQLEIISSLGVLGRYGQGATGFLLKLFKDEQASDLLRKEVLHTLVRINSTYESVHESLLPYCLSDSGESEFQEYACAVLNSLGTEVDDEIRTRAKAFKDNATSELGRIVEASARGRISLKGLRATAYSLSLAGPPSPSAVEDLLGLIEPFEDEEIKVLVLSTLRDITLPDDESTISMISGVMQYGSTRRIREQALLALTGIGSEFSLHQARSYGHKYIHGDSRPQPVSQHPFREWVLRDAENE